MAQTAETTLSNVLRDLGYAETEGLTRLGDEPRLDGRGFVWRELARKTEAHAAYFRGGVPLVVFGSGDTEARGLHRRLWNLSRVPVLVVAGEWQVDAYSCFVAPSPLDEGNDSLLATAAPSDVGDVLREFSRVHVEAGRLASSHRQKFSRDGRVDTRLLRNLRELRSSFAVEGRKRGVLDQLIGRSIFIRYFEDRGILTGDHLVDLVGQDNYLDVLRSGPDATYKLLRSLAERFNGDVFGFDSFELTLDLAEELALIAEFFSGTEIASGQQAFWPYDFGVIPPELISSVYEQLLEDDQQSDSAFYTPRHVADLILDETVPLRPEHGPDKIRVLDPSCGSGIFLTETFRRLAFRASLRLGGPLSAKDLAALLKESVFGVDLKETALSVASLSLYLALMEELEPATAWTEARLPALVGSNLVLADFFSDHQLAEENFDVIVGNPPWRSKLTESARKFLSVNDQRVPDQQIALAFLLRSRLMLESDGVMGLLMPSKALLHNRSNQAHAFRQGLFRCLAVESVIDLSPLRKSMFVSAKAPATVLIARPADEGHQPDDEILHVVPRLSPLQFAIDGFVISSEDVHRVPVALAHSSPDVWKVLLWGSERDVELIKRLRSRHRPLHQVAAELGWFHGQGFQIKGGDENPADGITGLPFVPTEDVQPFVVQSDRFEPVTASLMHRPRDPRLYRTPHVLIRRGLVGGRPAAALLKVDAAHTNGVFGVSARPEDEPLLELLVGYVNSALGQYFHFMTSSSWGVERDFIEAGEHLSLPFAEPSDELAEAVRAAVRQAPQRHSSDGRSLAPSELDLAVFAAFGLQEREQARILDVLSLSLDQFANRTESIAFEQVTSRQMTSYSNSLERELSDSLASLEISVAAPESSVVYQIATVRLELSERDSHSYSLNRGSVIDRLLAKIERESQKWPSPATVVQPSLIVLEDQEAHLVKPNERRYWTQSAALDDAGMVAAAVAGLMSSERTAR